jgi:uncharacterized membrane protein YdjX (TVP38/TMEM64 family)
VVKLSRNVRRVVLTGFVIAFVVGAVYLWSTGLVTPTSVQAWLESLGPVAPVLFIVAFVGGAFVGLPGMAFVIGGRLAFGPWLGFAVGYSGGLLAVTIPFVLARKLRRAGAEPWRPRNRHLARVFDRIDTHPFVAVLILRLVLWFNPPLSYALAFTRVSLRVYVAACAVALAPVVAAAMVMTSWFL